MSANDELQAHTCEKVMEFYEKPQDYVKKSHNKQDLERVADDSKTIDHIVDVNKKVSLTDKWKKGELKEGEYWCKITESPYVERVYLPCCDDIIIEVLAPVPSYEQWQQMKAFCEEFNTLNVAKENQKLKSLLEEWMHFYPIILYEHEDTLKTKDIIELYDRTREVLND